MKQLFNLLYSVTDNALTVWIILSVCLCVIFPSVGVDGHEDIPVVAGLDGKEGKSSKYLSSKNGGKPGLPTECPATQAPADCEKDKQGMEAIRTLHRMIDDDHNGNVDQSESDEFLRDELQYTDGFERQALFHNNDKYISVDDLWRAWKYSKVYNWTVDEVLDWLAQDVDLPQYVETFNQQNIDGSYLPRLVNATSSLLASLGIRNPVHKQKLSLKAMDTVLFGAPKRVHSYFKDLLLVTLIVVSCGGSWFVCLHQRYSQTQYKKMMKDLESLQKAEDALNKLKKELDEAELNRKSLDKDGIMRKNSIRLHVPSQSRLSGDRSPSVPSRDGSVTRREGEKKLKQAEEELDKLREQLSEAESRLEMQQPDTIWSAPEELKVWLQLTHELEQSHYKAKRDAAEMQLKFAREACEKIKKRNKAFLGSLRNAHSNQIDEIDQTLLDARAALEEVKHDLQERLQRWHTIELLCGFPIISNPGLQAIRQQLGLISGSSARVAAVNGPVSVEEADEDLPPADLTNDEMSPHFSERQRQQIFAWVQRSRSRWRPKSGNPEEDSSIYHKIPERQRQQIFAWARRSRHNWMMKNSANSKNSKTANYLPGTSKPFLKHGMGSHQNMTGSSGSLHLTKQPGHHGHHSPGTPPITFHLGETASTLPKERSSSTSSYQTIGHATTRSPSHFPTSISHPPYALAGHMAPGLAGTPTTQVKPTHRTNGVTGHNMSGQSDDRSEHPGEDSDAVSVGSMSSVSVSRRLERGNELDLSSLDSVPMETSSLKKKKKRLLPKFLRKAKTT